MDLFNKEVVELLFLTAYWHVSLHLNFFLLYHFGLHYLRSCRLQGSESVHQVIYLFDNNPPSIGYCQCDIEEVSRRVLLALPTVPLHFWPVPPTAPPSLPLDSSRVAHAIYMQA